ncbi:unnamed protein product [Gordionus sp. m RMFG-2023]
MLEKIKKILLINNVLRNIVRSNQNTKLNTEEKLSNDPSLFDFLAKTKSPIKFEKIPYINYDILKGQKLKVYFEIHGCQMNFNDAEIAWSILKNNNYIKIDKLLEADIILIVTCAIRESAELKIWNKLHSLKYLKIQREKQNLYPPIKIGILGCMAARLKEKIFEYDNMIDFIAGPDAYRDLPILLASAYLKSLDKNESINDNYQPQNLANVLLSLDETYADIIPERFNSLSPSAFV